MEISGGTTMQSIVSCNIFADWRLGHFYLCGSIILPTTLLCLLLSLLNILTDRYWKFCIYSSYLLTLLSYFSSLYHIALYSWANYLVQSFSSLSESSAIHILSFIY